MKRSLFATVALLVGFNILPAQAAQTPVPADRLEDFCTATLKAIKANGYECRPLMYNEAKNTEWSFSKYMDMDYFSSIISAAKLVTKDSNNQQPLLTFTHYIDHGMKLEIQVTTGTDFTTVDKVTVQGYTANSKSPAVIDLRNPDNSKLFELAARWECVAR